MVSVVNLQMYSAQYYQDNILIASTIGYKKVLYNHIYFAT